MTRLLCRLLWLANSSPPSIHRQRFYAMKHAILRRWAVLDGEDLQRVTKHCWACEGTGVYADSGRDCRRCWGSGVYETAFWRLARWRWHGRVFHTVIGRASLAMRLPEITIDGRVEHRRDLGRKPAEAALWLALLFDRGLFWRLMTGGCCCGWTGLPLCTLNQMVFGVMMHWRRCRERMGRRPWRVTGTTADDIPF